MNRQNQAFWEQLKSKYEDRNRNLHQREFELRNRVEAMQSILGGCKQDSPSDLVIVGHSGVPPASKMNYFSNASILHHETRDIDDDESSVKADDPKDQFSAGSGGKKEESPCGFLNCLRSFLPISSNQPQIVQNSSISSKSDQAVPVEAPTKDNFKECFCKDTSAGSAPINRQQESSKEKDVEIHSKDSSSESCTCNPCLYDMYPESEKTSLVEDKISKTTSRTDEEKISSITCNCSSMGDCQDSTQGNGKVSDTTGGPDTLKDKCAQLSTSLQSECSCLSLKSADLYYLKNIVDLVSEQKNLVSQVKELEDKDRVYQSVLKEFGSYNDATFATQQCPCCPNNNRNGESDKSISELKLENLLLRNELKDMRLDIRQYIEKMEGPMLFKVESEKYKCLQLEQKLEQAAKELSDTHDLYQKELHNLKIQLCTANSNLKNMTEANEKLSQDHSALQAKYAELEHDLMRQKLLEAEVIKKLNDELKQTQKAAAHKESCNLFEIARELSRTLKEAEPCEECQKVPSDLTTTAQYIKELADLIEGKMPKPEDQKSAEEALLGSVTKEPSVQGHGDNVEVVASHVSEKSSKSFGIIEMNFIQEMISTPQTAAVPSEVEPTTDEDLDAQVTSEPAFGSKRSSKTSQQPSGGALASVPASESRRSSKTSKEAGVEAALETQRSSKTSQPPAEPEPLSQSRKSSKASKDGIEVLAAPQEQPEKDDTGEMNSSEEDNVSLKKHPLSMIPEEESRRPSVIPEEMEETESKRSSHISQAPPEAGSRKGSRVSQPPEAELGSKRGSQVSQPSPEIVEVGSKRASQVSQPQEPGEVGSKRASQLSQPPEPGEVGSKRASQVSQPPEPGEIGSRRASQMSQPPAPGEVGSKRASQMSQPPAPGEVGSKRASQVSQPPEPGEIGSKRPSQVSKEPSIRSEKPASRRSSKVSREVSVTEKDICQCIKEARPAKPERKICPCIERIDKIVTEDERLSDEIDKEICKYLEKMKELQKDKTDVACQKKKCKCSKHSKQDRDREDTPRESKKKCVCVSKSLPMQEDKKHCKCIRKVSKSMSKPENKRCKCLDKLEEQAEEDQAEEDQAKEEDSVDQIWPTNSERLKVKHHVDASKSKDRVKSTTSIKCLKVKENFPFDVDTKVDVLNKPPDGVHITTTITKSGLLEVITEGPEGVIETTLIYTQSGNVEVVTEIQEYGGSGTGTICNVGKIKVPPQHKFGKCRSSREDEALPEPQIIEIQEPDRKCLCLKAPKPTEGDLNEQGHAEDGDKPVESEPGESEPGESEPVESEPVESEPGESEPVEGEPTESEPAESEPAESEPAESEPAESEPAESEPAESEPAESEPAESEPAESEPAESEPAESEPAESEPAESEPTESEPAEISEMQDGGQAVDDAPNEMVTVETTPEGNTVTKQVSHKGSVEKSISLGVHVEDLDGTVTMEVTSSMQDASAPKAEDEPENETAGGPEAAEEE